MSERFQELLQDLSREFERQATEIRTLRESLRSQPQAPPYVANTFKGLHSDSTIIEVHTESLEDGIRSHRFAEVHPLESLAEGSPSPSPHIPVFQVRDQTDKKMDMNGISAARPSSRQAWEESDKNVTFGKTDVAAVNESPERCGSSVSETMKADSSPTIPATKSKTGSQSTIGSPSVGRKPWYLINPDQSHFMSKWDIVTIVALGYVALVTPIQVGLMESSFDLFFAVSVCIDCIFLIDMFLQFFLMYPVKRSGGFEMENRHRKIINHYLRTWFPIDFLTILPFDLLSMALNIDGLSQMKGIKIIRLLRLLKLVRILKASRVFHRMEVVLSIPYQSLALGKFLLLLLLVCHWQSCIWSMTLTLTDEKSSRWVDALADMEKDIDAKTKDSPAKIYVAAFYFCSYTMTSVGYGDIGPKNFVERVVCIMIILVSGLCWAYILGEVCGIVSDMNAEAQSFRKRMDDLNFMMAERGLNNALRMRLRSYFISNKAAVQHLTQKQLLQGMSPTLQGEVSMALNGDWLRKVSFLAGFLREAEEAMTNTNAAEYEGYRACVSDVARILDTASYAQGEIFGEIKVLYILYKGLIGMSARVLKKGAVWGEDFVLSDASLLQKPMCTALTYVEVIFLTRECFVQVLQRHTASCPALAVRTRRFCVRVAARRGVVSYARRLKSDLEILRTAATTSSPMLNSKIDEIKAIPTM